MNLSKKINKLTPLSHQKKRGYLSLIKFTKSLIFLLLLSGIIMFFSDLNYQKIKIIQQQFLMNIYGTSPLVMEGGDPYIRALMRTISASESNFKHPYHVLYSGKYAQDLSNHPNVCIKIVRGPNRGKCTTAAGRYQFLNHTWYEKASKYHPQPQRVLRWKRYSFEPEYQDLVTYKWLNDSHAWGVNISEELKQGNIDKVLQLLSPTWTSLGYGIEDNSMSAYLPQIYQNMLEEELENINFD